MNRSLPGIGMRIIKSALAVAICYLINILRDGNGIVFYSQLAALWCIQMYRSNTIKNAIQRTIGTCVGATYGLVYLMLYPILIKFVTHIDFLEMILVSLFIILVLYTTILLKKSHASYFSCVVFLSIVVNHIGDMNPYLFVWNRFLDTMIGIFVGIFVNDFRLCLFPDRDTLFISGLDDTLLNKNSILSPFSRVELNRMIESGLKFTISTKRTPASLLEPMRDVQLKIPVIAMDGAVLYDIRKNQYIKIYVISPDTSQKLMRLILNEKICWYANVIIEDTLVIFHSDMLDDTNLKMVEKLRVSPLRNYVKRPLPKEEDVVYFMILDKTETVAAFYRKLQDLQMDVELKIVTYASVDYPGYSYIKIYNKNATKENMIMYLKKQTGLDSVITMGTIPNQYDIFIRGDNANEVVRTVRKLYEPVGFVRRAGKR